MAGIKACEALVSNIKSRKACVADIKARKARVADIVAREARLANFKAREARVADIKAPVQNSRRRGQGELCLPPLHGTRGGAVERPYKSSGPHYKLHFSAKEVRVAAKPARGVCASSRQRGISASRWRP